MFYVSETKSSFECSKKKFKFYVYIVVTFVCSLFKSFWLNLITILSRSVLNYWTVVTTVYCRDKRYISLSSTYGSFVSSSFVSRVVVFARLEFLFFVFLFFFLMWHFVLVLITERRKIREKGYFYLGNKELTRKIKAF